MHEMSLCESVLQIIEQQAQTNGFQRVKTVRLEIGALAGVELEAMRFGFDAVTRKSIAQGATLDIIELPGRAWCLTCGQSVEISQRYDPCPACGSYTLQVTGGDELRVKDLEVE
ncbi:MAG: hydrogenase maturation nickel metallochaperone HypA [Gammaproteobacteria bacterium]|jgi:hydrogenase nickel incorporation protein HypA/HybF